MTESTVGAGHNRPPSYIDDVTGLADTINKWLADNPVIETEDSAKSAKELTDRYKAAIGDAKDELRKLLAPHQEAIDGIRGGYTEAFNNLKRVTDVLDGRVTAFLRAEKARREEEAKRAKEAAERAIAEAREAEKIEQAALAEAAQGVLDVDVQKVTRDADGKFDEAQRLSREALRAQNNIAVKIAGGFKRAIGLRRIEELIVVDAPSAVRDIGPNENIKAAILTAARAHRRQYGKLPVGVIVHTDEDEPE